MKTKQELIDYIMSLTPEQVDKVVNRLDLLQKVVDMTEAEAIYSDTFISKLFFPQCGDKRTA